MIDLHTHSNASDGTDPPAEIPRLAASAGCSALALTDHDTLTGLAEARAAAAEVGVRLVDGCEVACAFRAQSVHVLVYFVTEGEGPLQEELARLRSDRVARNRRMVEKLADAGLPVSYDEVVAEAATEESAGRPHVAAVLVRNGAVASIPDAFDRWLAAGRPGYVPKARVTPAEIATLARDSGGVAVLAHPLTLGLAPLELDAAVDELADAGFGGIEAVYGRYSPQERADLTAMAHRHGLVATGGSDYHGTVKPDLTVGTGRGDLKVPDAVLDDLETRRPS